MPIRHEAMVIGTTISHYRILEKLGGGGMGIVYKAEDTKLRRTVALKFLPAELTRDETANARFVHEAQAASALDHPHICTIFEIDSGSEGQSFIAMAYYEGETLKRKIERGPVALEEAVEIACQIAEGLQAAHTRGIIHRDIKPPNIVLTAGMVKILDFGIAKLPEATGLTLPGSTYGTASYMAPEQTRGEPVDARTDLWALGVVLYEMVSGRLPFRGDSGQALIYSILNTRPEPLKGPGLVVHPELGRIVSRALNKQPGQRYPSAADMLTELRALQRRLASSAHAVTTEPKRLPSIAVLPFSDMSPQRDQDYFCEGIAEELINALASLEGVRVASRTSSFQFKGQAADIRRIGEMLNVETILEGSVRKAGNRLRITAQLINVTDGYHLWSERYDRDLDDVFAVQDEITRAIVERLKVKLAPGDAVAPIVKRRTQNLAAYNLYLQGRYYWSRRHTGALRKSLEYFERSIAEDPEYAPAHAGLADGYIVLAVYSFLPPEVAVVKAQAAAEEALRLDPNLGEAHHSMGFVHFFTWRWRDAERDYRRAIELSPNIALTHGQLGIMLSEQHRFEEALSELERAKEIDPVSPMPGFYAAGYHTVRRQYDRALEECHRALEIEPNFMPLFWTQSVILSLSGRHEEALDCAERVVALSQRQVFYTALLGMVYARAGRRTEAEEILAELEKRSASEYVDPLLYTHIYTALGDTEHALDFFERAVEKQSAVILFTLFMPACLDPLRSEPRFQEMIRRVGLPL